jgi:CRISPR-associated autoregulator DevR family
MTFWSISFAYRLGLAFHALNNEGSDGSNLMQPRRIDVGNITYDGISGEIIRRHILESFINACHQETIELLPMSEGLHPDRGPIGIRVAAKKLNIDKLNSTNVYTSIRRAIELCAVLDVGGYLAAWKEGKGRGYIAEKDYIDKNCAEYQDAEPVKRDSCFDAAWLVSENPQDLTITQHSTFRDTFKENDRYAQTMRTNVYSGVVRADLQRIGTDDYWYLTDNDRLVIPVNKQQQRQCALIDAIGNFIASPTGAKTAGWAPHVFFTEGAILLTSARTAPFVSPIRVELNDSNAPVKFNTTYAQDMEKLKNDDDTWVWQFSNASDLLSAITQAKTIIKGNNNEKKEKVI